MCTTSFKVIHSGLLGSTDLRFRLHHEQPVEAGEAEDVSGREVEARAADQQAGPP